MATIYHNPRCSKSRAALELLESRDLHPTVIRYLDDPPSAGQLAKIINSLGISPRDLVRTGEKLYKELGLADKKMTDQQWIETMAEHPKLIERPIVLIGNHAAIGRPLENIIALLDA